MSQAVLSDELQRMIKPGEFTFCSRCGEKVQIGNVEFMCSACKWHLFGHNSFDSTEERQLHEKWEQRISSDVRQYRRELAELRLSITKRNIKGE